MNDSGPGNGRTLAHAEFFGDQSRRHTVAGFTIASVVADPTLQIERHTHETGHFIVLLSGQYVTTARGADAVCVKPALIYNPPGTTHRDRFRRVHGRVDGRFISVAVDSARMGDIARSFPLVQDALYTHERSTVQIGMRLARELADYQDSSSLAVEAICLELFTLAIAERVPQRSSVPPWLRVARDLIQDYCAEGTCIADIASACDVHPVYLARVFRKCFGCSPGEYLRRCRIERAAALLAHTTTSPSLVALQCGYADQSHLNASFRRAFGLTPAEYRRVSKS
ncbi:MAG TPA: helix-turn-helix transcriptional regulator [Gemmatimonadaceae bacterium]